MDSNHFYFQLTDFSDGLVHALLAYQFFNPELMWLHELIYEALEIQHTLRNEKNLANTNLRLFLVNQKYRLLNLYYDIMDKIKS